MQIRQNVVQRLKDKNIPRIGNNVFEDRSLKLFPDELPAICVYTRSTPFEGKDRQPRYYQATTELVVESIVRGDYDPGGGAPKQGIAEQLNRFSEAIVQALIYPWDSEIRAHDDPPKGPFDGLAHDVILASISSDTNQDGETVIGGEAVTLEIEWESLQPNQEPPDAFARMGVEIKTPPDANADALDIEDVVEIPQT
jgi:hypothetical protein